MLSFFDMMGEAIDLIISFFVTIATLISNLVTGLFTAFQILSSVVSIPLTFSILVPGIISASMFIFVAFAVIKFIIGR